MERGRSAHELDEVPPVAFSPTGATLVTVSGGSVRSKFENGKTMIRSDPFPVKLWDARTGALKGAFQAHERWLEAAAFSDDGTLLATVGGDGTVKVWRVDAR